MDYKTTKKQYKNNAKSLLKIADLMKSKTTFNAFEFGLILDYFFNGLENYSADDKELFIDFGERYTMADVDEVLLINA